MHERSRLVELENTLGSHLALLQLGATQRGATIEDRYQVDRILGRGAFGLVVRAHDPRLQRRVAIKCVPSRDPAQTLERIASEAQALAALEAAPHVARVHDCRVALVRAGEQSRRCVVIVMEYVDGVNLRRWSANRRPREQLLEVLCNAARGLEAAHAADIVHRDFKPENVVVPPSNDARVVDFGLAYRLASVPATTSMSLAARSIYGTRQYMAPEARLGAVSASSDQFSFAVTAWELLTGQLPFADGAESSAELRGAERLPWQLTRVLRHALAPTPEQRFTNLAELRAELEHFRLSPWQRSAPLVAGVAAVGAMAASFFVGMRTSKRKGTGDKS